MPKEQVFYPETQPLFKKLEELTRRSGVSRGQAFEDWLTAMVCALAAETKEAEYMLMVERHKKGKHGQRGIDLMPQMFGELVNAMTRTDADILGDLFQGSVTYGESGQYFSPASVAELLAVMSVDQTHGRLLARRCWSMIAVAGRDECSLLRPTSIPMLSSWGRTSTRAA